MAHLVENGPLRRSSRRAIVVAIGLITDLAGTGSKQRSWPTTAATGTCRRGGFLGYFRRDRLCGCSMSLIKGAAATTATKRRGG